MRCGLVRVRQGRVKHGSDGPHRAIARCTTASRSARRIAQEVGDRRCGGARTGIKFDRQIDEAARERDLARRAVDRIAQAGDGAGATQAAQHLEMPVQGSQMQRTKAARIARRERDVFVQQALERGQLIVGAAGPLPQGILPRVGVAENVRTTWPTRA